MLGFLDGVCARMCACVRVWEWGACKCVGGYVCGWVGGYGCICVIVSMQEHALFGMLTIGSMSLSLPQYGFALFLPNNSDGCFAFLRDLSARVLSTPTPPPPLAAPNLPRNVGLRARHRHILSLDHVPSTDPTVY